MLTSIFVTISVGTTGFSRCITVYFSTAIDESFFILRAFFIQLNAALGPDVNATFAIRTNILQLNISRSTVVYVHSACVRVLLFILSNYVRDVCVCVSAHAS